MRGLGKSLLAGTLVGTLTCAAATSFAQSVFSDQVQTGDVLSDQTLDVVTIEESTTATTTATGNAFDARQDGGDVDMRVNQNLQGNVSADTRLNVAASSGATTVLTTAATGNTSDAGVFNGTLTGVYNQTTGPVAITGHSHTEAPNADAGDVSSSVQAIGNSQGVGVSYGVSGVRINQTNEAQVTTDGGGVYGQVNGAAAFVAATAANNITTTSEGGSSQRIIANQANNAGLTQAAQFTAFGQAYVATTQTTATGNNVSATNQGPLLDATIDQTNVAYVRSQAETSAAAFSSVTATAYGIGNSSLAGNLGEEVIVDNTQFNEGGGVESVAAFTGGDGYDGLASATAIGNAATGFACSDCGGRMTVSNRQTNDADVGSTSSVTVSGSGRAVAGVSTAIGNTASYYTSRPSQ
jgi:hypothetical protein